MSGLPDGRERQRRPMVTIASTIHATCAGRSPPTDRARREPASHRSGTSRRVGRSLLAQSTRRQPSRYARSEHLLPMQDGEPPEQRLAGACRPIRQRRGCRRRWLLRRASDSHARLQVTANRAVSKHLGVSGDYGKRGRRHAGHGPGRPTAGGCAPLANRRCEATRASRLGFVLARASDPRRRARLCPTLVARGGAVGVKPVAALRSERQRRRRPRRLSWRAWNGSSSG